MLIRWMSMNRSRMMVSDGIPTLAKRSRSRTRRLNRRRRPARSASPGWSSRSDQRSKLPWQGLAASSAFGRNGSPRPQLREVECPHRFGGIGSRLRVAVGDESHLVRVLRDGRTNGLPRFGEKHLLLPRQSVRDGKDDTTHRGIARDVRVALESTVGYLKRDPLIELCTVDVIHRGASLEPDPIEFANASGHVQQVELDRRHARDSPRYLWPWRSIRCPDRRCDDASTSYALACAAQRTPASTARDVLGHGVRDDARLDRRGGSAPRCVIAAWLLPRALRPNRLPHVRLVQRERPCPNRRANRY